MNQQQMILIIALESAISQISLRIWNDLFIFKECLVNVLDTVTAVLEPACWQYDWKIIQTAEGIIRMRVKN